MPNIGYVTLALAFMLSIYAFVVSLVGVWQRRPELLLSSRNATFGVAGFLTLSIAVIEYLLITGHYQTKYVHDVSNLAAPLFYRMTALWGGQDGSLLFWAWLMALAAAAAIHAKWETMRPLIPYVIAVSQFTVTFFIGLVIFIANPFEQLPFFPLDGQGLNPLLRHFGMIIHPPMLYIGFVAFVVPFAFGMAALITRQTGDTWIRTTRRWTLIAWMFLSIGLLLGGWWAYDVLGWGGYWGWDPVENASLIPWLVATPFLHSVMMQENRGMLKRWNMALIIMTFCLVIEGTFLTRSGMLSSVHSFAESAIGPLFLIFITIVFAGAFYLFVTRWDDLSSDNELDSLISRESFFLLNNLLFIGLAVIVWWGTHYPLITEAIGDEKIVVGPPFFEQTTAPLWAALVLLMGVAPLLPWRRTSLKRARQAFTWPTIVALITMGALVALRITIWGAVLGFGLCAFTLTTIVVEYWRGVRVRHHRGESYPVALKNLIARNRRRYGGYMIHLGVILIAIGVIGSQFYQTETQQNIAVGESMEIHSDMFGTYTMTYQGLQEGDSPDDRLITEAYLTVSYNGETIGELVPVREYFVVQQQPMTIPDKMVIPLLSDLYVILGGWEGSGETATFKAYINPLVNWLWVGGFVFIAGTMVAAWPTPEPKRRTSKAKVSAGSVAVG
ncbi:heme lyase CcmF/NrfE family subunit [Anaerolineales bacterium HSG6]|nr:heme lyase CcmF/NrfE family subunit [Anaerolineales bacterium HSG6]MDM8531166.1 heme lyase CcmF/NrfE family subunit [Anaerolineales bacterium HSG25]